MTNGAVSMRAATIGSMRRNSPASIPRAMSVRMSRCDRAHDLFRVEAREVGEVVDLGMNQPKERCERLGANELPV